MDGDVLKLWIILGEYYTVHKYLTLKRIFEVIVNSEDRFLHTFLRYRYFEITNPDTEVCLRNLN
jgi:hypothetical protein